MKHVFIINPCSGKKEFKDSLENELNKYTDKLDYEIYYTKKEKDAINFVDSYCKEYKDDVTFYACGGDGTLNEVVNGAINHKNAIVSCYPCGSGNDFVKLYGGKERFLDLNNLIYGKEIKIDVMKVNDLYAINVTNFGFDAKACQVANKVRRKKIIGGNNSYTTGILVAIFKAMKNRCKVIADGEVLAKKAVLLSTIANGKYIGGGYCCAPYTDNTDGLLEISVIKPISIFRFAKLVTPYKNGSHLEQKNIEKILKYRRVKEVNIDSNKEFLICLDGEIYKGNHFDIVNLKQALRFKIPLEEINH